MIYPQDGVIASILDCGYNHSLLRIKSMQNNEGGTHVIYQRRHNGQSLDEYRHYKMLPHINEEYQFRITNKLLVQKIANPRRDRIIIDSLAHTSYSQFYKNKKVTAPHQETSNYRRKIVLTADRKMRQKLSNSHESQKVKQEQAQGRTILPKNSYETDINKDEGWKQDNNGVEQQKNDDIAVSRMMDSHSQGRNNYIGKIVRNNSSYFMRVPKKGILKNNYCFNRTYAQESQKQISREQRPQLIMKRIVRRIYQDGVIDKQNIE